MHGLNSLFHPPLERLLIMALPNCIGTYIQSEMSGYQQGMQNLIDSAFKCNI